MIAIRTIFALDTLEALEDWCAAQDASALVASLHHELDARLTYKTAAEWNALVRVIEALNISGWADRAPLEPVCFRSPLLPLGTWLERRDGTWLHRRADWRKRKGGVYLSAYEDIAPDGTKTRWRFVEESEIRFSDGWPRRMRNRLPSSPISLRVCASDASAVTRRVEALVERFQEILQSEVNPTPHWSYLQDLRVFYHVGRHKAYRGPLKIGAFRRKACAVFTDVSLKSAFLGLSDEAQKRAIAAPLMETIKSLGPKLAKTKTPSNIETLIADVERALSRLLAQTVPTRPASDVEIMASALSEHIDEGGRSA